MPNAALQNLVGLQPDGIAEVVGFQIVEQFRDSEGGIATKIFAPQASPAIALHDRIKHGQPIVRAMNVARTQGTAFKVAMLVEDEQRMTTAATEVTIISRGFLLAVNRAFGAVDVQDQIGAFAQSLNPINPLAGQTGQCGQVF